MSAMRTSWRGHATVVKTWQRAVAGTPPGRPGSTARRTTQQAERTRRSGEAPMARRDTSPDFIEALARGLDVIRAFQPGRPAMSLAAVAGATGLARPTARRILLTLDQMGYVRAVEPLEQMGHVRAVGREAVDPKAVDRKYVDRRYELTPRVLELGMS